MLSESTKKRIREQKIYKHSNPSVMLTRVKTQSSQAIEDLTTIIKNVEEEHLDKIFTAEKLEPLILALLKPKNLRVLRINEMLANRVSQKLMQSSSPAIMDVFIQDIGKSSALAHLMVDRWKEIHSEEK